MPAVPEVSEQDWNLWRSVLTMHQQLSRELDRRLQADAGISQAEFAVLVALSNTTDRRLRTGELAEIIAWEKSRVSHQVARLEARGFVERTDCDTDARGTWVGLTYEGRRVVLGAMRDHGAALREHFFALLGDDEKAVLAATAERVLDELNPAACELAADAGTASARRRPRETAA